VRLLLIGPPGAGKGTQAAVLSEQLGIPHVSTGDLFRAHIADETPLGLKVKEYLDSGVLVPDEITNEMARERLAEAESGFLLDGFPRNAAQADMLDEILSELEVELDAVVQLDAPEEAVVERLLARGRADDTEDVIRHRQEIYRSETAPLLDHYADRLVTVPAVGSVEEITERALDAVRARR
jgi:adenylate kinase